MDHDAYCQAVDNLVILLKQKRDNPFEILDLDPLFALTIPDIEKLENVVTAHGEKIGRHDEEAGAAARRVELYHVKAFDDEYRHLRTLAECNREELNRLREKLEELDSKIAQLENVDGDPVPGADELTGSVSRVLGCDELKFDIASDGKHYVITRRGSPATNLSEGEQTAIALLYFLVSVRRDKVKGDPPVVIIDDPVSSLDNEILFGVSAHMWAELVENDYVSQFYLMTHNFELFRH